MKEEGRTAWRHPRLSLLTNYIPIHYTTQGQPDNLFRKSDTLPPPTSIPTTTFPVSGGSSTSLMPASIVTASWCPPPVATRCTMTIAGISSHESSFVSRRGRREREAYVAGARMGPDGKHKRSECASVLSAISA